MTLMFDFKTWRDTSNVKRKRQWTLILSYKSWSYTESRVVNLDVTLGQRKLLAKAIRQLRKDSELACGRYLKARQCRFYTCNNKVLAKDGGLDEML